MPEANCLSISESMTYDDAAISEPLSIGVYAVRLTQMDMRNRSIGILGFGPIGMSVMLPALQKGAGKVYVTDQIDKRLTIAKICGAAWTGNPVKGDVVALIKEQEPELLDVVFHVVPGHEAPDVLHVPANRCKLVGELDSKKLVRRPEILAASVACISRYVHLYALYESTVFLYSVSNVGQTKSSLGGRSLPTELDGSMIVLLKRLFACEKHGWMRGRGRKGDLASTPERQLSQARSRPLIF